MPAAYFVAAVRVGIRRRIWPWSRMGLRQCASTSQKGEDSKEQKASQSDLEEKKINVGIYWGLFCKLQILQKLLSCTCSFCLFICLSIGLFLALYKAFSLRGHIDPPSTVNAQVGAGNKLSQQFLKS